jgi:hypothetical protein
MRLVFKKGKQKKFLQEYKELKKCSWRRLSDIFSVDWRTIRKWRDEIFTLPKNVYEKIIFEFPELSYFEKFICERRDDNWGRRLNSKLGWAAVKRKIEKNIEFKKKWTSKKKSIKGPKNELFYNNFEKSFAEFLTKNKIRYKYEPTIKINENLYFPDFIVNSTIIELCGVAFPNYLKNLKKKLHDYELFWDGKIIIVISSNNKNKILEVIPKSNKFIIFKDKELRDIWG